MDFEEEADADEWRGYSFDQDICDDFVFDGGVYDPDPDTYDPDYTSQVDETRTQDLYKVGVARVPLTLLQSTATLLQKGETLPCAWMLAIGQKFRKTSLGKVRQKHPSLLPPWLLQRFENIQDVLVLRREGIFARSGARRFPSHKARFKLLAILAATSKCRFREGSASEGMLCNNPPIPLRVLDFLEHAEDLLNLALVCKATHEAGHVLLQREFSGVWGGPRHATYSDVVKAVKRRKRSMLESALRHPITCSRASASAVAAGMAPAACADMDGAVERRKRSMPESTLRHPITCSTASTSATAAGMEPQACAGADTELADVFVEKIPVAVDLDRRPLDKLHCCMFTLLRANRLPLAGLPVVELPHPNFDCDLGNDAHQWRLALWRGLRDGFVMDAEAAGRAVADWGELVIKTLTCAVGEPPLMPSM